MTACREPGCPWDSCDRPGHNPDAQNWLRTAPAGLAALIRRMTWHHRVRWEAPDYIEDQEFGKGGDGRKVTTDLDEIEAVSSALLPDVFNVPGAPPQHMLAIDLDVPAWLVPSSTEGHGHLYVDLRLEENDLWEFLAAAAKIGLVEEGYVNACKSRGMTSLRAPWIRKGAERPPGTPETTLGPDHDPTPCCRAVVTTGHMGEHEPGCAEGDA